MTSTPDALASAARELALAALHEITPASTIGPAAGHVVEEDGSVSLRFETRLRGYPGWYWTVGVAQIDDAEPTVLEAELMPGEGALLAPDWVPWAERLAEYRAHQAELAAQAEAEGVEVDEHADESDDDDLDDVDDLDAADFDEDGSPHLHGGDLDGVDIDELDEESDADDDPQDDDSSDDESDDDDDSSDDDEADADEE